MVTETRNQLCIFDEPDSYTVFKEKKKVYPYVNYCRIHDVRIRYLVNEDKPIISCLDEISSPEYKEAQRRDEDY
jgi:hypothetical protein